MLKNSSTKDEKLGVGEIAQLLEKIQELDNKNQLTDKEAAIIKESLLSLLDNN